MDSRKHVLFATMQYGPGYYQGTERYLQNISRGLANMGYRVTIAAGDPQRKIPRHDYPIDLGDGITLIPLPSCGWATIRGSDAEHYRQLLASLKPDICHLINPAHIGIELLKQAQLASIKTAITVTDYWWMCPKHTLTTETGALCEGFTSPNTCWQCIGSTHRNNILASSFKSSATRPFAKGLLQLKAGYGNVKTDWQHREQLIAEVVEKANVVICLSDAGSKLMQQHFPAAKICPIPVGLSDTWFKTSANPTGNTTGKLLKIGFAGAIAKHKGLHILIDAISRSANKENIELHYAGRFDNNTYRERIEASIRTIHSRYHGLLTEAQMQDFIDQIDVIAVPSLWPENQPQIIWEAFARMKPVITSSSPGAAELVPAEFTYVAESSAELAKLLESMPTSLQAYSIPHAPHTVDMTRKTEQIYQTLCAS